MSRHILAMGGGGFAAKAGNLALDKYFLELTGKENPKVCFIPTASGDSKLYIEKFTEAYQSLGATVEVFRCFAPIEVDISTYFSEFDAIYVGGGNTRSMMSVWQHWGIDAALKQAYRSGVVCAGLSAGANCWFEESHSDSIMPDWCVAPGLGILSGSVCPHFTKEGRQASYETMIGEKSLKPGIALDDGAAVHFIDEGLFQIVVEHESCEAYQVSEKTQKLPKVVR